MGKYEWLIYVAVAGLAWGTYVPIIFYGGSELGGKPNSRLVAILCVGVAYFVVGVLLPLVLFTTGVFPWPKGEDMKTVGLVFAGLAGVAGAVGAIGVIFATKSALEAATTAVPPLPAATYRVFIAPLIFGLAPVINVLVSTVWHPTEPGKPNDWTRFAFHAPHPLLWVGIILVGVGAGLVLYSKELTEASSPHPKPAPATTDKQDSAPTEKPHDSAPENKP
jgi:hypothetical protein